MSHIIGYKKNWYKEWFGEEYLTVYKHRDDKDAQKLIALILSQIKIDKSSYLLDLACGNGRHAFLLSGYSPHVYGLDLSVHLLHQAQNRKKSEKAPSFVRADMRYFPFRIKFDVIFSLFTSFGYFDDDDKHLKVALEISESLNEGGSFVLDYFNPAYVRKNLVPDGKRMIDSTEITEKRWLEKKRVFKSIHIQSEGEDKEFIESVRMFELDELTVLLEKAGIFIREVFGNYKGDRYKPDSKRMIIFAKK